MAVSEVDVQDVVQQVTLQKIMPTCFNENSTRETAAADVVFLKPFLLTCCGDNLKNEITQHYHSDLRCLYGDVQQSLKQLKTK